MDKPKIGLVLGIFIAVLAVSTSAIFVRLAEAPAAIIATYRLGFTVLLMIPFIFLSSRKKELFLISRKDWLYSSVAGVFLALHFILWFESLNYTSVASSVVLVTLQPIFAFIGTYLFFSERLSLRAILSGVIAMTGSIIISWGDFKISGTALFGDLLALAGAVMVTGYFLFGQHVRKRVSLLTYTFVVYGMSTITLLLYDLVLQYPLLGYDKQTWMYFILLALIPTLLGHTIFNWAIKWVSTTTISMSILFEPIGAAILAYFILNEITYPTQWIGGSIVIIGLLSFILFTKKDAKGTHNKLLNSGIIKKGKKSKNLR